MSKICKDGRIWGQNNKARGHLGILISKYKRKFTDKELKKYRKNVGKRIGFTTYFQKGSTAHKGISHSEKTRKLMQKPHFNMRGSKNPHWKGGISSLHDLIRHSTSEARQWREEVFKRDNYTCQKCSDKKGHNLEAHHKRPFAKIFSDFLKYYNQFSPFEDKETLLRLAITYKPFWDVDNGITMCEECHKEERKYVSKI